MNDHKAQNFIVATVEKSIMVHLMSPDTAKKMYDVIVNLFENNAEQPKCELLTQFYNYKWNSKSASEDAGEIKNIAYKLKTLKEGISYTMVITKILAALPDKLKYGGIIDVKIRLLRSSTESGRSERSFEGERGKGIRNEGVSPRRGSCRGGGGEGEFMRVPNCQTQRKVLKSRAPLPLLCNHLQFFHSPPVQPDTSCLQINIFV